MTIATKVLQPEMKFTEITVTVGKTIQEQQYEPLAVQLSVTKTVQTVKAYKAIDKTYETLEHQLTSIIDSRALRNESQDFE